MEHCMIFSHEIYYVTIALCLNIQWLKAVKRITHRQTRTSLRKHDVKKVCIIDYLTTQIELVLPTFFQLLDCSQNYRILRLGPLSSLWNIYYSTTAYFLTHPVDYCDWLSYFSLVFLDFRYVSVFYILTVSVRCICVLPLSGVIKNNNNNKTWLLWRRRRTRPKVHYSLIFVLFCIAQSIFFIPWELSTGVKKIIKIITITRPHFCFCSSASQCLYSASTLLWLRTPASLAASDICF